MAVSKDYIIQFAGLKPGLHQFDYQLSDEFFNLFDFSEIENTEVDVVLSFDKSETMLVLDFQFEGAAIMPCDRCLEDAKVTLQGTYRQIIKFAQVNELEEQDDILLIPHGEYEIDVAKFMHDMIQLNIPSKVVHPEGECDPEVLGKLEEVLVIDEPKENEESEETKEDEIDQRWSELLKLKNKTE